MNIAIDILDFQGKSVGSVDLSDNVFNVEMRDQVVYDIVRWHRANKRQGTKATKGSGDVSGSTKKMRAQKETGKSRQGDGREGHLRGGGHIFELRPGSHKFKLNKKVRALALKMCLSAKVSNKSFVVVEDFSSYNDFKTTSLRDVLSSIVKDGLGSKKILLVSNAANESLSKSANGIKNLSVLPSSAVNSLALLGNEIVIVDKGSVDSLESRLG